MDEVFAFKIEVNKNSPLNFCANDNRVVHRADIV